MAEITHDEAPVADDGFHEIQLGGKQLVFLFMIAAVVLVATFLCGVQVGRGVRSDRSVDATSAEALATTTPPPAASTSSQPAVSSGPPAAEPPAPAQEREDELSYPKRLQGDTAPAEKLKTPPSPGTQAAEEKSARASAPKAAASAPAPVLTQTQTPKQTQTQTPMQTQTTTHTPTVTATPASSSGQPGAWVVQLVALKDRGDATAMANRLSAKGYPAFVLDPAAGAPAIYRVQVGGYPDRDHADQAARRIEKEEKIQGYVRSR
jgi:cell division septation protein DedD